MVHYSDPGVAPRTNAYTGGRPKRQQRAMPAKSKAGRKYMAAGRKRKGNGMMPSHAADFHKPL